MNPVELIRKKRNGEELDRGELAWLLGEYVRGSVPDYQMSAFLMAVYFRGMSTEETWAFTDLMLHSGTVIDLSHIPGIKVDKHSTGGIGDKVSLILAPMVAACGVPVPMISGRGLGHTGGTLDKLESIPGFRTRLSISEYREVIAETGVVLAGQTEDVAPADRRMYSLRDVTATVESIPLIAGSIMSKKLAEGIDALVLDVKTGDGAFMRSPEDSALLARTLVDIGTHAGKKVVAFITGMDEPLGNAVGNWCEVVESVECLRGKQVKDLMDVTYTLGGAMVYLGGKAGSIEEGKAACQSAIWSGRAYEKFLEIVRRQGGDVSPLEEPSRYQRSARIADVTSTSAGYVSAFGARAIGILAVELGAGRMRVEDAIDPKAGILFRKKIGDRVEKGEVLAQLMTDRADMVERGSALLRNAITITTDPPTPLPLVRSIVDAQGTRPVSGSSVGA